MRHKEIPAKARILIIDDDLDIQALLNRFFKAQGFSCDTYGDAQEALEDLTQNKVQCDVIITDLILPGISGIEFTQRMKAMGSLIPIILITAHKKVETAVDAIRSGAYDFVVKPLNFAQLLLSVERALYLNQIKEQNITLKAAVELHSGVTSLEGVVGKSNVMKIVLDLARRAAKSTAPVLITGESGTGKELIAKAIYTIGPNSKWSFTPVNCTSIPENLLESELFGHTKGYFNSATEKKVGLLEEAGEGILFLDDIGDLSPNLQSKLVRVLADKKLKRLGETQYRPVKVRFIAATNKNLRQEIQQKRFREDLFFQLNVFPIRIPPLRERREDILPLAEFFLRKHSALNNIPLKHFSQKKIEFLLKANWSSNVRELENDIERSVVLSNSDIIDLEESSKQNDENDSNQDTPGFFIPFKKDAIILTVDEVINKYLVHVLKINQGVKEKTAKDLHIDRKTLYRRLREIDGDSD